MVSCVALGVGASVGAIEVRGQGDVALWDALTIHEGFFPSGWEWEATAESEVDTRWCLWEPPAVQQSTALRARPVTATNGGTYTRVHRL